MLVELGLVEQRYGAVREVLEDGASVTEVAHRYGVVRQTVHEWLTRYGAGGLAGLTNRSTKPERCPHQMPADTEARVVQLRITHPEWGARRIRWALGREGSPLPSLSAIYRALVRHQLIEPHRRRRKREDYKRWERERSMELWQMDVVGRIRLADGSYVYAVTGIDDHSRFCVCAKLVRRATSGEVCSALLEALAKHGLPEQILTDNGKVFTGRFSTTKTPVRFDRICHENGIHHLLTAPYSPTTTGKVERLHKTMRREHFSKNCFATIEEAQAALDKWVDEYNMERPHQSIGDAPPGDRFLRGRYQVAPVETQTEKTADPELPSRPTGVLRSVDAEGVISVARCRYRIGRAFMGESVEVIARSGLLEIFHRGVLVASHRQKKAQPDTPIEIRQVRLSAPRKSTTGQVVRRIADSHGQVSFAGTIYRVGRAYSGRNIDVCLVAGSVQCSVDGIVVRVHPARHDPTKEYGALAQPKGRGHYNWPSKRDASAG